MVRIFNASLLTTLALFLAACGGSSPPAPSSITLTVDPGVDFNAAAYQVGSGPWQTLNLSGSPLTGTFNLNGETKYGVAVRCSSLVVRVIQATAGELPNPKLACSASAPSTVAFTLNLSVASSLFASGDQVCVNSGNCQPAAASMSIALNLTPGTQDLLVTLQNGSAVKVAKVLKGVSVSAGGNHSASLGTSDQLPVVNLSLPTPPAGYTLSGPGVGVLYLSAGGAQGGVNASLTSYRPVSGFSSGDLYGAIAAATGSNASLSSLEAFSGGAPILSLPAPWASSSLTVNQTAHPSVSGLSRSEADLRWYKLYLQIPAQIYYTAFVSKGWLGSTTTYALPDLSSPLGYIAPSSGSGSFELSAFFSNKAALALGPGTTSPQAGDYLREAKVSTSSFSLGGGSISLP